MKLIFKAKQFMIGRELKPVRKAFAPLQRNYYDVGVVGWWNNSNYGGILTYYALHQTLRKMGFRVLMIDRCKYKKNDRVWFGSTAYRFAVKHYHISQRYTRETIKEVNRYCRVFLSGSDQLFNPTLWQYSGPQYFLDFVEKGKKRISYASSFGNRYNEKKHLKPAMGYWLRRFDRLSAREDYGAEIFRDVFSLKAEKVLDPVFLCDVSEYERLASASGLKKKFPYLLSFFLDPDSEKRQLILELSEKMSLKYINLIDAVEAKFDENTKKLSLENTKTGADVEEWLFYYRNADFIITDSFHGTCFAIIFRKPFISIANKKRGLRRFESVLSELGLMDRLIYDISELSEKPELFNPIDYEKVFGVIEEKARNSYEWLYDSIKNAHEREI